MRNIMKRIYLSLLTLLLSIGIYAEEKDTLFIELTDSSTVIIPYKYIEQWEENEKMLNLHLTGDTVVGFAKAHIVEMGKEYRKELPKFESFKFNNKFNDQLFTDAEGDIDETNGTISAEVGCIGKRLTPSFKVTEGASAYINGKRQYSKKSRLRFDDIVHYTVAFPKQYIYKILPLRNRIHRGCGFSDRFFHIGLQCATH